MDLSHLTITFGELLTILVFVVGLLAHYFSTNNRITKTEVQLDEFKEYFTKVNQSWIDTLKRDIDTLFKLVRDCPGIKEHKGE